MAAPHQESAREKKFRHILFWKVSGILLLILAIEGGVTGTVLYFLYGLKGDAHVINYAGHLRWRSYEMPYLVNRHFAEGIDRDASRRHIEERLKEFENILYGLRDSNSSLGLKGVKASQQMPSVVVPLAATGTLPGEEALWARLTNHINKYEEGVKPAIIQALNTPDAEERLTILSSYDMPGYVMDVNQTVKLFSEESNKKVARLQIFLFAYLGVIIAIIGATHFLAWAFVERPILEVHRGMQALVKGDLRQKIPVRTRDEVGELAKGFNVMAGTIENQLKEIRSDHDRLNNILANMGCLVRVINPETHKVSLQNEPLNTIIPDGLKRPCYNLWKRDYECDRCVCSEAIRNNAHRWKEEITPEGVVYEVHAFPFPNPDGTMINAIEVIRDITAKRRMEAEVEESRMQVLQSQKMAAIGSLSSGVAHSINNPLSGINLFSDVLLKKVDTLKDTPVYEEFKKGLTEIKDASKRCETVVKDLLRLSRVPKPETLPVYINETLEHTLNVFVPQLKLLKIQFVKEFSPTLPKVLGSSGQLETVFMNVISNAIDAMPEGGTLTVKSMYIPAEKKVEISITDTGCGISKKDLPYIFNPYFTTKPPGRGTGIGLSSALLTVQSHRGTMEADSEVGRGTTIKVRLPVHQSTLPRA